MADLANKYAENVTGKYFVDDQCIDCDLCRKPRLQISSAMMTAATATSTSNQKLPRRRLSARRRKKAAPWKLSETTANSPSVYQIPL